MKYSKEEHCLLAFIKRRVFTKIKSTRGLKDQYPVTAHAPNFDFLTGCREFKRREK